MGALGHLASVPLELRLVRFFLSFEKRKNELGLGEPSRVAQDYGADGPAGNEFHPTATLSDDDAAAAFA